MFQSLNLARRDAMWQAQSLGEESPLYDATDDEPVPRLSPMSRQQAVVADYRSAGLSLRDHPMKFLREALVAQGVVTTSALASLESDRRYQVAGIVLVRQRPGTAKGITFMTIEDETGVANLIVHPGTWARFRKTAKLSGAIVARGLLQRQDGVIHLVVDKLTDLPTIVSAIGPQSRDFR